MSSFLLQSSLVRPLKGIFLLLLFPFYGEAQSVFSLDSLSYERGTAAERSQYKKEVEDYIRLAYTTPADSNHWSEWSVALWAMELMLDRSPKSIESLNKPLNNFDKLNYSFKRALLEAVYTLAPGIYCTQLFRIAQNSNQLKLVLMCRAGLLLCKKEKHDLRALDQRINKTVWRSNGLLEAWKASQNMAIKPSLKQDQLRAFVSSDFLPGKTIVYSFQQANRNYEGMAVIRKSNGEWVKNEQGSLIGIPQLARSLNALPWYLTNGNTPQGLYAITGIDTSDNEMIGQTPNLQLVMPFEVSPARFFQDSLLTGNWQEAMYTQLFPPSVRNYLPLMQSWYAGKAGRTEIIAHGTTVDPSYYRAYGFYPNTPTMGCLSCSERYDTATGKCVFSNQLQLVNAFLSGGSTKGFLLVLDIDDRREPVSLAQLNSLLQTNKTRLPGRTKK